MPLLGVDEDNISLIAEKSDVKLLSSTECTIGSFWRLICSCLLEFRSISALRQEKEQKRSIFEPLKQHSSFSEVIPVQDITFCFKTSCNTLFL